jgi:uncharacterized metal-binding protein YceD (DUF177 family)
VNRFDQYEVVFSGLKPGTHTYIYEIGQAFFEYFENTGIKQGRVRVLVTMEKEERMMNFRFDIDGNVQVPCDRCNELTEIAVNGRERLIVKLGDAFVEESEEVQVVPESINKIDLGPFIYEYICLLLPARKVHPEDNYGNSGCDPEILKKLDELSGHHHPDPRWEALEKLRDTES